MTRPDPRFTLTPCTNTPDCTCPLCWTLREHPYTPTPFADEDAENLRQCLLKSVPYDFVAEPNLELELYNAHLQAIDELELDDRLARVLVRLRELDSVEAARAAQTVEGEVTRNKRDRGSAQPEMPFYCNSVWHLAPLSKYHLAVHDLMLTVQSEQHGFFGSKRQIAEYVGLKDDKHITKVCRDLQELGWLEIMADRPGQTWNYRALKHLDWAKKYPNRCCVLRKKPLPGIKSAPGESGEGVNLPQVEITPQEGSNLPPGGGKNDPQGGVKSTPQVSVAVAFEVSEKLPEGSGRSSETATQFPASTVFPSASETPTSKPKKKSAAHRDWIFKIWSDHNRSSLAVQDKHLYRLEKLIGEHGEKKVAWAWYYYVHADPRPYNTDPVEIAVKKKGKDGREWLDQAEDSSQITRFPLASFLSMPTGYLATAETTKPDIWTKSAIEKFGVLA